MHDATIHIIAAILCLPIAAGIWWWGATDADATKAEARNRQ